MEEASRSKKRKISRVAVVVVASMASLATSRRRIDKQIVVPSSAMVAAPIGKAHLIKVETDEPIEMLLRDETGKETIGFPIPQADPRTGGSEFLVVSPWRVNSISVSFHACGTCMYGQDRLCRERIETFAPRVTSVLVDTTTTSARTADLIEAVPHPGKAEVCRDVQVDLTLPSGVTLGSLQVNLHARGSNGTPIETTTRWLPAGHSFSTHGASVCWKVPEGSNKSTFTLTSHVEANAVGICRTGPCPSGTALVVRFAAMH